MHARCGIALLILCSLSGCHGILPTLTPEEARAALQTMLAKDESGSGSPLRSEDVTSQMPLPEEIALLSEVALRGETPEIWIGQWYCQINEQTFERRVSLAGGHAEILRGVFQRGESGIWTARIVETIHVNTGPRIK
jgi:hypothetical protein